MAEEWTEGHPSQGAGDGGTRKPGAVPGEASGRQEAAPRARLERPPAPTVHDLGFVWGPWRCVHTFQLQVARSVSLNQSVTKVTRMKFARLRHERHRVPAAVHSLVAATAATPQSPRVPAVGSVPTSPATLPCLDFLMGGGRRRRGALRVQLPGQDARGGPCPGQDARGGPCCGPGGSSACRRGTVPCAQAPRFISSSQLLRFGSVPALATTRKARPHGDSFMSFG